MVVQDKTEKGWVMSDLLDYADGKWTNEKVTGSTDV